MCTFVLAVTTYVFYAQNEDNKVAKEESDNAANEATEPRYSRTGQKIYGSRIGVTKATLLMPLIKN